jgi:hypothetical protein
MTRLSGVYITVKYDSTTVVKVTDENGNAVLDKLPKNTDINIQFNKDGYMSLNLVLNNKISISPRLMKVKLEDPYTGQIIHTEDINISPNQEIQLDYQISGYQRVSCSIIIVQT